MDSKETERELAPKTRGDLINLAAGLEIAGRHRMNKNELIEAIGLMRMFRSLPDSLDKMAKLKRKDLLRLCELVGVKVREPAAKSDLVEAIRATANARAISEREEWGSAWQRLAEPAPSPPLLGDALPDLSETTRVALLAVGPHLVHTYWEVASRDLEKAKFELEAGYRHARAALRFYDVTDIIFDGTNANSYFDVDIDLHAKNWYVDLWSSEKAYCTDLGVKTQDGRFFPLARSNVVDTPRTWPSDKVGESYILIQGDYAKVESVAVPIDYPTQFGRQRAGKKTAVGSAPIDSAELLRRRLAEIYAHRLWSRPPHKPGMSVSSRLQAQFEKEAHSDLTDMSEKKFVSGISSQLLETTKWKKTEAVEV
ncbi:MAG: DUF4912 domain-containing protein [Deltaproteobacteria bacterium]|nr:MAG: DUF4912 domain-containing protein [Deltaproteobacteria bacterium]